MLLWRKPLTNLEICVFFFWLEVLAVVSLRVVDVFDVVDSIESLRERVLASVVGVGLCRCTVVEVLGVFMPPEPTPPTLHKANTHNTSSDLYDKYLIFKVIANEVFLYYIITLKQKRRTCPCRRRWSVIQ